MVADFLMNNFDFSKIEPNYITLIGIISNILIFLKIENFVNFDSMEKYYFIESLIFIKFLTDTLDGAVARKFNKTSKIGNFLDTLADEMFQLIALNFILHKFNLPISLNIIYLVFSLWMNYYLEILDNHKQMKKQKIIGLISNNIMIISIGCIYFYNKNKRSI